MTLDAQPAGAEGGAESFTEPIYLSVDHRTNAVVVLAVTGDVDMLTAPSLRTSIGAEFNAGCRVLVLDLGAVRFLGCEGLVVLVDALRRSEVRGVDLRLVCGTRSVRRPLTAFGLDGAFHTFPSLAEALHVPREGAGVAGA